METLDIGVGVYSLDKGSGLDMCCYQQIEELSNQGHNVSVYYIRKNTPDLQNINYIHTPQYRQPYKTKNILSGYDLNKHDFFCAWGSPWYMLAPHINNFVLVEFGIPQPYLAATKWEMFVNTYIRGMTLWAARHSKIILAGSEYLYNKIYSFAKCKDNVFTIHSGIKFNDGIADPVSTPYALFVGRHVPYKNVHHLIKLFREVKKQVPDASLFTIGNQSPYPNLLRELSITPYVQCKNYVDDLWAFYRNASVYATCSLWEGEDRPVLEAQSMGVPVVSYDNCSHPEVVHYGRRVRNDRAFIDAMVDYLKTPQINTKIGDYIKSEYCVESVVSKWVNQVKGVV